MDKRIIFLKVERIIYTVANWIADKVAETMVHIIANRIVSTVADRRFYRRNAMIVYKIIQR